MNPSFDQFEQAVRQQFRFLTDEFGFGAPVRRDIAGRYRHVAYQRPSLALEFAVEAPEFLPWWTAVRLIGGEYPSGYAVDELRRSRRLYPHQITRAIRPHLDGTKPVPAGTTFHAWSTAEAEYLRRYARYFLDHSDSVFEQVDRDKHQPPKRKLP